jgi:TetR/AcrR family transcriptional repressor of nem operon
MSKAERTRQFIIEQAAPLFNEKGIAGTSIDDVLRATQVAKGCLYGHFENKEALAYASVDYMLAQVAQQRDALIQTRKTAKGKVHAFMKMNQYPLSTLIAGGCPILNLSTEADDTSPVIKQKVKGTLETALQLLTDILEEGIQNGEFSARLQPEAFALKMLAAIEGGTMICRTLNSNQPMQKILTSLKQELEECSLSAA